jgi:hypothetical protein
VKEHPDLPIEARWETDILDHSAEFAERVLAQAPARYRQLASEPAIRELLGAENAFNAGKLCVYAEFQVFREEFDRRFPGAEPRACINAFCRLFLKNDISLSNLVRFFEGSADDELARMQRLGRRSPPQD